MSTFAPMHLFICKVASRCNIDCDYCYVYHHVDQSWRHQPQRMALQTATQLGLRIGEHARRHGLPSVEVVMHGGEPLLAGTEYLDRWCDAVASSADGTLIDF